MIAKLSQNVINYLNSEWDKNINVSYAELIRQIKIKFDKNIAYRTLNKYKQEYVLSIQAKSDQKQSELVNNIQQSPQCPDTDINNLIRLSLMSINKLLKSGRVNNMSQVSNALDVLDKLSSRVKPSNPLQDLDINRMCGSELVSLLQDVNNIDKELFLSFIKDICQENIDKRK